MPTTTLTCGAEGVRLTTATHECEIATHGAHVTSWRRRRDGRELLFTSSAAVTDGTKAIRGGIPVCFPQFSDLGPCAASHGFARTSAWEVGATTETTATFTLRSGGGGDARDEAFPHAHVVEYVVCVDGEMLTTTMRVTNEGEDAFEFTTALHTYFRVGDCERARVEGLKSTSYLDSLDGRREKTDEMDAVEFHEEVDRIYLDAPAVLKIRDASTPESGYGGTFTIEKSATLPDAVVWNPWVEKSKKMGDFRDDEYREMVCVEVAGTRKMPVAPGATWEGSQTISFAA